MALAVAHASAVDKELRRLRASITAEQRIELNGLAVKAAKKKKKPTRQEPSTEGHGEREGNAGQIQERANTSHRSAGAP